MLKSVFNKVVAGLERLFDEIELSELHTQLEAARAGYMIVPTIMRVSTAVELSPEMAAKMITASEARIATLREKHRAAPQP